MARQKQTGGKTGAKYCRILESDKKLFNQLEKLSTEQRNTDTLHIDLASPKDIVTLINREDKKVADAVGEKRDAIARAIELTTLSLRNNGRLIYAGAGTSGRLGVLDAAECPPTFGTEPETVQGLIAGGEDAMFVAQEGAEDHEVNGENALRKLNLKKSDIVCGLAASGRTPYVHGALKFAADTGCKTILVTTVPADQIDLMVDVLIDVPVGPEVIMGSTRMKSATAQKMILNMITTGTMIRLGKVYENVMVDLKLTNRKLEERAKRIIMFLANESYENAEKLLIETDGNVKTALLMALSGFEKENAERLLDENNGFLRKALKKVKS
jgi:N-acetylmuramic acid 6-phosphate etherase